MQIKQMAPGQGRCRVNMTRGGCRGHCGDSEHIDGVKSGASYSPGQSLHRNMGLKVMSGTSLSTWLTKRRT